MGMLADLLVILALFAVRLAIPLLIIMVVSYALYRWLGGEDYEQAFGPVVHPAPPATTGGLHCYDIRHCPPEVRAGCPAMARPDLPCWMAIQLAEGRLRPHCPDCPMYQPALVKIAKA
jgi:hypothetical protein